LRKQPVVVKRRKVRFAGRVVKAKRLIQIRRNVIPGTAEPHKEIVADLRTEAMRCCINQRMRHRIILRHNPAFAVQLQPLAAPLNRRAEQTRHPHRHTKQIAYRNQIRQPQHVAASQHKPTSFDCHQHSDS
jgi:hypothetical protein